MLNHRLLPLLLILSTLLVGAACGVVPYLMYVTPFSHDGCTVTVIVPAIENSKYASEVFRGSMPSLPSPSLGSLYDVSDDDDIYIEPKELVYFEGEFTVDQYGYVRDKWYFNIDPNGLRTVQHATGILDGISAESVKEIDDNDWIWVNGDYVENFEPPFLTCEETDEVINVHDSGDASVSRLFLCLVDMVYPHVPGRVGPGENRAIRALVPQNRSGYNVHGRAMDEGGELWYVLDVPEYGFLWVPESQTISLLNTGVYGISCGESSHPQFPVPPVTPAEGTAPSDESNIACIRFVILSPLDSVPAGITTFEWTAISDAEQYHVLFFSEDNLLATQLTSLTNSITVNTGELPTGSQFTWEVYAVLDGQPICKTSRSNMLTRQAYEIVETQNEIRTDNDDNNNRRRNNYTPPDEDDDEEEGDGLPPDDDDGYTPPDGYGDPPSDEG